MKEAILSVSHLAYFLSTERRIGILVHRSLGKGTKTKSFYVVQIGLNFLSSQQLPVAFSVCMLQQSFVRL